MAVCPDGCGQLIAWTEIMLPFNAASMDEVRSRLRPAPGTGKPAITIGDLMGHRGDDH